MAHDEAHAHGAHGAGEPHVLPLKVYFAVFGALIMLTGLTVAVSVIGLGPFAIAAAVLVAIIKSALVVGFFMHLKYEVRFLSLIFFSCVLFLGLFFGLTMADLAARDGVLKEEGTHYTKHIDDDAKKAKKQIELQAKAKRKAATSAK